jgi:hypothetical protein
MTKVKNQAELEIEALADIFNIAGEGFEDFHKEAEEKSRGNYSTAASSGNYSTAASSGNSSTAASSGNYSTAASSGNSSTAASSGYSSKAASSGNYSTAASSGNSSTAASSGNSSTAASSGNSSTAASSGNSSTAASSGNYSACAGVGYRAAVKGDKGNLVMASEYVKKNGKFIPVGGKADIVDGKKIKANAWYIVEGGEWVEVDYSDGIFSRVLSTKNGVKKVKTDNNEILFIASDANGNHAHGETIKRAVEELAFKTASRDVEQYRNMPLTTKKTPAEWSFVYRVITGACTSGTKSFMESRGKLKAKYTLAEIIEQTNGAFGSDKFKEVVGA